MGRGGQTLVETKTDPGEKLSTIKNDVSKTLFTREEVRKHNKKDDIWLIINENVYDVTGFLNRHPGGFRILKAYGGEDASVSENNLIIFIFQTQNFKLSK